MTLDETGYSPDIQWCGPSAVAMLAGIPLKDAHARLCRIRGERYAELEGSWIEEQILALHELGFRSRQVDLLSRYPDVPYGPTLKRYFRERPASEKVMPTLIWVDGHVLTGHYEMAGDNWTKRMVPWTQFPKLGRLVKAAFIIEKAV